MELSCIDSYSEAQAHDVVTVAKFVAGDVNLTRSAESRRRGASQQPEPTASAAGDEGSRRELTSQTTFTVEEAAVLTRVSEDIIHDWITKGELSVVHVDGEYIISRRELSRTWREMGGGELFDD